MTLRDLQMGESAVITTEAEEVPLGSIFWIWA